MSGKMAAIEDALRSLEVELLRSQANLDYVSEKLSSCFAKSYPDSNPVRLISRLQDAQDESKKLRGELEKINTVKSVIFTEAVPRIRRSRARVGEMMIRSGAETGKIGDKMESSEQLFENWANECLAMGCSNTTAAKGEPYIESPSLNKENCTIITE